MIQRLPLPLPVLVATSTVIVEIRDNDNCRFRIEITTTTVTTTAIVVRWKHPKTHYKRYTRPVYTKRRYHCIYYASNPSLLGRTLHWRDICSYNWMVDYWVRFSFRRGLLRPSLHRPNYSPVMHSSLWRRYWGIKFPYGVCYGIGPFRGYSISWDVWCGPIYWVIPVVR